MTSLRARFEAYWDGSIDPSAEPPMFPVMTHEEVAPGSLFVSSFANVTALRTDDGLVLVDAGGPLLAAQVHAAVRSWSDDPVRAVVYTHGHVDHVVGVERFEAEQRERGRAPFTVYAHEDVSARFARYAMTRGYNACINARQFQVEVEWPRSFREPDETYREQRVLELGGERVELHHARGETDDATWVWLPGRKLLCAGDLFIWAAPNAGNPQKVQRYPREWALALRAMAALDAEVLLPGHGLPLYGRERIARALTETAALLEHLHDETLARMNAGMRLDDIVREVQAPPALLARPYLRPFYDEPEFIVRNVWRLYGGWWDGDPTRLQPAPAAAVARELCALAGGAAAMAARAMAVADEGDLALASHLIEHAALAAPDDAGIGAMRRDVYARRAAAAGSLMARGIYTDAASGRRG
jgi:alkyl sulfatase BDS1-like metallo-beta-lactamase superfamily hydrolase